MPNPNRTLSELIAALGDEQRKRAMDIAGVEASDTAFADLLGLTKDALQQDIDFLHEIAVHVAALGR